MTDINSIAFALDPTNVPAFLLDWEVTKLCNLDCTYCTTGVIWGSHDNTTKHPPVAECLKSIDFMYEYVDLYMSHKKLSQRKVNLNVYGGESLFHPDIVEILEACRSKYEHYRDRWYLTLGCTTNGIVGKNLWAKVVPLIDEITMSYHSENLPKQKQQFKDNVLYLKQHHNKFKVIIMMHNNEELFNDSLDIVEFCNEHDIRYLVKPVDRPEPNWKYTGEQFNKLKTFWMVPTTNSIDSVSAINEGRACCGGRKLSINGDLKSSVKFVPRQGFQGWSCSVNWFFLFVQQLTGDVYTNKDCRMSTTGRVEPLGNINDTSSIIDTLREQLATKSMPIIHCIKDICRCGFCAPKAETEKEFMDLITRNVPVDVFQKEC